MGSNKVTMKSEGVYITLEEQERIMEELLQESSVYAADHADGTVADSVYEGRKYQGAKVVSLDGFEVTNNTGDEYVDEEYVPGPVEDPDYGVDPCEGCEDHVDGKCISNGACADAGKEKEPEPGITLLPAITHGIQFFMPMRKVPTSTAQEKGYRVIPNGYSHVNGVKKPRFRVVTFDKPGTAEAKAELTAALNTALKKIERQWKAEGADSRHWKEKEMDGSGKNDTGARYWKGKETEGTIHDYAGGITQQRKDGHGLRTPLFGRGVPLSLTVKWCFGSTAVESGKVKDGTPRTTKPDTDNLDKMLKDCMTALGFWWDDAQVAEEHIGKYWSRIPGVFVRIEVIRNE